MFETDLVLTQQGKLENDLKRLSISGQDNEISKTTVQGLDGLVGALLELLVVGSLLDHIEDGDGELGISKGISLSLLISRLLSLTAKIEFVSEMSVSRRMRIAPYESREECRRRQPTISDGWTRRSVHSHFLLEMMETPPLKH